MLFRSHFAKFMKGTAFAFILLNCLGHLHAQDQQGRISWLTNYEEALVLSQKECKPLLIYFTASDWSGWCMKVKKEILDTDDFQRLVAERFICVEIDFPFYKLLPTEQIERNQELKEKLEISEYPRIVLVTPDERILTKVGYLPGGGENYGSYLLKILRQDDKLTEAMKHLEEKSFSIAKLEKYYKRAKESQREEEAQKILSFGLKQENPLFFLLEKYRLLMEEGKYQQEETAQVRKELLEKDPNNEKGIQFSLALIDFQELSAQLSIHQDPKAVILPLEQYIEKFGARDLENVWRVEMMIAQFYLDYDENIKALHHAETAFESAPDQIKPEIKRSLDYIKKQIR